MSKIEVNQLALAQVLDRFAALSDIEFQGLETVQLRASKTVLEVTMFDTGYGIRGRMKPVDTPERRPYVALSVLLPCSTTGELAVEVELDALATLLKAGDDAGFDQNAIEIDTLDGVDLLIEQFRPGGVGGFSAMISYSKIDSGPGEVGATSWAPFAVIGAERLAWRMGLTLPAMASAKGELGRPELACLTLGTWGAAASDGHRLHIAGGEGKKGDEAVNIPASLAWYLPKLIAGSKLVEIETGGTREPLVRFKTLFNDSYPFKIVMGAHENAFPNVAELLEEKRPIVLTVNGPIFASTLKRAIDLGVDKVLLRILADEIKVCAGDPGVSRVTLAEGVPCRRGGAEERRAGFAMHFDARYLLDALGSAQGPVTLKFMDPGEQTTSVESLLIMTAELLAVVMPRRP